MPPRGVHHDHELQHNNKKPYESHNVFYEYYELRLN
jgi:hypothetical protein